MKRLAFCIGILVLLPGQVCNVEPPTQENGNDMASGYRKITLSGTIGSDHNQASVDLDEGEGLTTFEYTGNYNIELWFPAEGGAAVQQNNTIVSSLD